MKLYGIVVIYNKLLKDSASYNDLKGLDINLVVCDNSPSLDNENQAKADGIPYIAIKGNKGLAVAYNKGISYIREELGAKRDDFVCIFDDDTHIPGGYVDAIRDNAVDNKILLPIVSDEISIMSPVYMKKNIASRFKSRKQLLEADAATLSGINSGMAISMELFIDYRYNEGMFLDYIDYMFIRDMRMRNVYPKVVEIDLKQNFSAVNDDKESALARFRRQKRDLRIFYENEGMAYNFIVIKKTIKLAVKYRDLGIIFGKGA